VARAAAVIGQDCNIGELQALLPKEIDPVTLSNHLSALKNAGLMRNANSLASQYTFHQAVVRDILYNSLPHEKRRELHQRLADHLPTRLRIVASGKAAWIVCWEQARRPSRSESRNDCLSL